MDHKLLAKRFPILASHMTGDDAEHLERLLPTRVLVPGEVLVAEGDHPNACWLLWDGMLAISVRLKGRTLSLGRFSEGVILGEVAFSDGGPATATVTAAESATLYELEPAVLERICREHPSLGTGLLAAICDTMALHLRLSTDRLENLRTDGHVAADMEPRDGAFDRLLDGLRDLFGLS